MRQSVQCVVVIDVVLHGGVDLQRCHTIYELDRIETIDLMLDNASDGPGDQLKQRRCVAVWEHASFTDFNELRVRKCVLYVLGPVAVPQVAAHVL